MRKVVWAIGWFMLGTLLGAYAGRVMTYLAEVGLA